MKLALVDTFDGKGSTSPLGLLSIATYLREFGDFDVIVVDTSFDNLVAKLEHFKPDIVGISAYTYKYNVAVQLAQEIKQKFDIPIFIGGSHITLAPYSLDRVFEFGVLGEGEQTTLEVMKALKANNSLSNIPGLQYHGSKSKRRALIEPLDKIPIADRSYASPRYFEPVKAFNGNEYIEGNMLTSRGCPYRCPFCATSRIWEKIRFHSTNRILEEVSYLRDTYHVNCINIWDDFFTVSKKRVKAIAHGLKVEGLTEDIEYRVQVRVNTFDSEMAHLLDTMNVTNLNFGFESGSSRVLNRIKKDVTLENIKDAVSFGKLFKKMQVTGSLIFGMPNESIADMRKTLDLMDYLGHVGADFIWFFVATPYPGTEWWNFAEKLGQVSQDMDWSSLDLKNVDYPLLLDPSVKLKEYHEIIRLAERKVRAYFRVHAKNRSVFGSMFWALKNPRGFLEASYEYLRNG